MMMMKTGQSVAELQSELFEERQSFKVEVFATSQTENVKGQCQNLTAAAASLQSVKPKRKRGGKKQKPKASK